MTPGTRAALLDQLARHEGLRLKPYRDTKGFWTVGYGHNMDADPLLKAGPRRRSIMMNGITKVEARAFLDDDVEHAIRLLIQHLPWCNRLDEVRQAVMVELCFNMGIGHPGERAANGRDWKIPPKGLRSFRNTLALIERGMFEQAATNLLWNNAERKIPSKWHADVKTARAARLAGELRTGLWPTTA